METMQKIEIQNYCIQESQKYNLTPNEFYKILPKDFVVNKSQEEHPQIKIKVCNKTQSIEVDEDLGELLEIINRYELNTIMSCQYDKFGYCNIQFTYEGFKRWVDRIYESCFEKYGKDFFEIPKIDRLISRFSYSPLEDNENFINQLDKNVTNKIIISSGVTYGIEKWYLSVCWKFNAKDIEQIVKELNELFK